MADNVTTKIRPEEITIDSSGKVVINNPDLKKKLSDELEKIKKAGGVIPASFITLNLVC